MQAEGWRDYVLLPWWFSRYLFAWLWAKLVWYPAQRLQIYWWPRKVWFLPRYGGRHVDPDPVRCELCGWAGMRRWCYHGYASVGDDDVEPEDYCPRCETEI